MKKLMTIHFTSPDRFGNSVYALHREDFCRGYPVRSGLLVCPICCELWAKLSIEGSGVYEPRMVSCLRCQWHHQGYEFLHPVPGSLLDNPTAGGVDWEMLEALPPILLQRELELTLKAWDSHPW